MPDSKPSQAEVEMHLNSLLDSHQKWLMQQREMLLLWPLDRNVRRRIATLLAKELLTIPVREFDENTPPNRAVRRAIMAAVRKGVT